MKQIYWKSDKYYLLLPIFRYNVYMLKTKGYKMLKEHPT